MGPSGIGSLSVTGVSMLRRKSVLLTVLVASGGSGVLALAGLALAGLASCAAGAAVLLGAGTLQSRVRRSCVAVLTEDVRAGAVVFTDGDCVAELAEAGCVGCKTLTGGGRVDGLAKGGCDGCERCIGGGCGGGGPGGRKPRRRVPLVEMSSLASFFKPEIAHW